MLLFASCWVPCDGLASHPEGIEMLQVTSCWVPCDGQASHPIACVAGGIVRVRHKILTVESEYGRQSRVENGKEPL